MFQRQSRFMIMSFPIFFFSLLPLLLESSHCTSIVVDGSSEWKKNHTVYIGDSIIFKHKQHHNIYIFQDQKAFDICNFTQATLLTNPNTTSYTWYPSSPGFFYFSFNDGSIKACLASQKLAIKVTSAAPSPPQASTMPRELSQVAAPAPSSVGEVSSISSPPFPWPFRPHQAAPPALAMAPDKGGGMPFINSNPAVPLPAGEVDSATIHPLPFSGHEQQVMIASFGFLTALHSITLLLLRGVHIYEGTLC